MCVDLGNIFREARLKHKLTLKALLERIGGDLSQCYLSRIEHNNQLPSPFVLRRLIEILELKPDFIVNIVKQKKLNKYRNKLNDMYKWL